MRSITVLCLVLICLVGYGQRINPHEFDIQNNNETVLETGANLSNDTTIDIGFYNIDIEIALDSAYLSGRVKIGFTSLIEGLDQFKIDLDDAFSIDSISSPASSYTFLDNILTISLAETFNTGDQVSLSVYYSGAPVLAGGYKGLRYEVHDNNEIIIASLSTPYLAHTWWPCKDGTQDKSDSTFINITIKDTTISSIPVIAVSNGLLDTVETIGNKKKFRWKHYYPVVPYYVMVAISNYDHFNHNYSGITSFPIDYYVFESHKAVAEEGVTELPDAMAFFESVFGPYPFADEKYGMTQLGYYGAIENQTNTITNNMSPSWFFVSVHELAHMWFADMITCNTWHHGWLNEGFASYAEALYSEHQYNNYNEYMDNFLYYNGGTVYMEDVSDPFSVFQSIIYNKGAYVLHMLRGVVGDSLFFDIVYDYASDDGFMYKLVTTEEFQEVCENISGLDLNYFFDQWIYDEYFPIYGYNFGYNESEGNIGLVVKQSQGNIGWREVFEMPMEVELIFLDGTDTIVNIYNSEVLQEYTIDIDKEIYFATLDPNNWILKNSNYDPSIIVDIPENQFSDINIFPNPSSGEINIDVAVKDAVIQLVNIEGKVIYKTVIDDVTGNALKITGLSSGIYTVMIINNGNSIRSKKVVVK